MTMSPITLFHEGSAHVRLHVPGNDEVCCAAWEVSDHVSNAEHVVSDSHLQFLTSMEADACLNNLFDALAIGGRLDIIVPDADYFARQWLDAVWDEQSLRDTHSDARQGFAGLFGWQQGGNPLLKDYRPHYDDCHKSAYNTKRLKFLLRRVGFVDIEVAHTNEQTLLARAFKTMRKGERQISPDVHNIRADHLNRYRFAASQLANMAPRKILDLACGIGYGSHMLAEKLGCVVVGVDVDEGAIAYAKEHYVHPDVTFLHADARELDLPAESFDAVVSFETIEHVDFDDWLLRRFHQLLRRGGRLVASTPNQDVMPHDPVKFPFHIRHYRVNEISAMVTDAGFQIVELFTQRDPVAGEVVPGDDGAFTIIIAEKT